MLLLKCCKTQKNTKILNKNAFFLHFFSKKFAYIKKKLYLCNVIQKQHKLTI